MAIRLLHAITHSFALINPAKVCLKRTSFDNPLYHLIYFPSYLYFSFITYPLFLEKPFRLSVNADVHLFSNVGN